MSDSDLILAVLRVLALAAAYWIGLRHGREEAR